MSLSNSPLAYADCYDFMDRAINDPIGARVAISTENAAVHMRMRCHQARNINRTENSKTYPNSNHPLNGKSPYDVLVLKIKEENERVYLYAERYDMEIDGIEMLSEVLQVEHEPIQMIEHGPARLIEHQPSGFKRRI